MTVVKIDENGIPRTLFSGKIVDVDNLKPNLPKMKERQYEAPARDLNPAVQESAKRALFIASIGY